jgi:hypothetical protein
VERRLERHFEEAGEPNPRANRADAYEATSIQLVDGLQPALEGAHAPQVAALAQVHIFCSAALEGHVNIIAHGHLTRGQFQAFDKLPLYGKWMFLPSAFGNQPLDPGCEPVQSVQRLSRLRNDLIHHKPIREAWRLRELPQFVADLGLTVEQGAESLKGVYTAVARLASIMSRPKPRWLSHRPSSWLTSDANEDLGESPPRSR